MTRKLDADAFFMACQKVKAARNYLELEAVTDMACRLTDSRVQLERIRATRDEVARERGWGGAAIFRPAQAGGPVDGPHNPTCLCPACLRRRGEGAKVRR